jgi:hypothetical protein
LAAIGIDLFRPRITAQHLCDLQIEKLRGVSETGDANSRSAIREALDVFSRISRIAEH